MTRSSEPANPRLNASTVHLDASMTVVRLTANKFSVIGKQNRKTANFSIPSRAARNHAPMGAACVLLLGRFAVPSVRVRRSRLSRLCCNYKASMWHENEYRTFCPICEGVFKFPKEGIGQTAKCPHCNEDIALIPRDKEKVKSMKVVPTTQQQLESLRSYTCYGAFRTVGALAGGLIALIGAIAVLVAMSHGNAPSYGHEDTAYWVVVGVSGGLTLLLGAVLMLLTPLLADIADAKLDESRFKL